MKKCPALYTRRSSELHLDNVSSQTSVVIRQKLMKLAWEVLIHLPDSTGSAHPHLHPLMVDDLADKKSASREACETWLSKWCANWIN